VDIEDEAAGGDIVDGGEEGAGGIEGDHGVASRAKKAIDGAEEGGVVIDDGDEPGGLGLGGCRGVGGLRERFSRNVRLGSRSHVR